jgi:hypothetical protein
MADSVILLTTASHEVRVMREPCIVVEMYLDFTFGSGGYVSTSVPCLLFYCRRMYCAIHRDPVVAVHSIQIYS